MPHPDPLDLIEQYRDEQLTLRELAQRYDVALTTIRDWFSRAGIAHIIRPQGTIPSKLRPAAKRPLDPLTRERLARYHAMLDAGLTQTEIARREGISKQSVNHFLHHYKEED